MTTSQQHIDKAIDIEGKVAKALESLNTGEVTGHSFEVAKTIVEASCSLANMHATIAVALATTESGNKINKIGS